MRHGVILSVAAIGAKRSGPPFTSRFVEAIAPRMATVEGSSSAVFSACIALHSNGIRRSDEGGEGMALPLGIPRRCADECLVQRVRQREPGITERRGPTVEVEDRWLS